MNTEVIMGMDFGSSNCSVSYYHKGEINSLYLDSDSTLKTCPTTLHIDKSTNRILVAQKFDSTESGGYFHITNLKKRLISKEPVYYKGKELSLTHLIGEIYLNLKRELELKLCLQVKKVVITVPAYFGEEPRHILKNAAKLADLEVLRVINEPTAAAIWFSNNFRNVQSTYLFIDVGGLTIDMSICNIINGVLDVVSAYGNTSAGHGYLDQLIYEDLLNQIKENLPFSYQKIIEQGVNLQLLNIAENLKKTFSDTPSSEIFFHKEILIDGKKEMHYFYYTKEQINSAYLKFMNKIKEVFTETLHRSGLDIRNISKVVLVGGPASSTLFRKQIESYIPVPLIEYFDNITSVSKGAALYGSELVGGSCNIVLSDILPISIGVKLENGAIEKILPANIKLPNYVIKEFTTTEDYQTTVRVSIYQGERLLAKDCVKLGEITLEGIELARRGCPVIKVILQITQEGVINGYVLDQKTKKEASLTITSKYRSTPGQILILKEQAIKYREADLQHIQILNLNTEIRDLAKKVVNVKSTVKSNKLKETAYFLESKINKTLELNYKKKSILKSIKQEILSFLKKANLEVETEFSISISI